MQIANKHMKRCSTSLKETSKNHEETLLRGHQGERTGQEVEKAAPRAPVRTGAAAAAVEMGRRSPETEATRPCGSAPRCVQDRAEGRPRRRRCGHAHSSVTQDSQKADAT